MKKPTNAALSLPYEFCPRGSQLCRKGLIYQKTTDRAPEKEPDSSGDSHSLEKINTHSLFFKLSASVPSGRIPQSLFQL